MSDIFIFPKKPEIWNIQSLYESIENIKITQPKYYYNIRTVLLADAAKYIDVLIRVAEYDLTRYGTVYHSISYADKLLYVYSFVERRIKMKYAIIGSRNFNDYNRLKSTLDHELPRIDLIISGGASGADTLAEKWADENNIPSRIFHAEWEKYGKSAGFIRNRLIIDLADKVIAFWDGKSKGTANSISLAKKKNKKVSIVYFDSPIDL